MGYGKFKKSGDRVTVDPRERGGFLKEPKTKPGFPRVKPVKPNAGKVKTPSAGRVRPTPPTRSLDSKGRPVRVKTKLGNAGMKPRRDRIGIDDWRKVNKPRKVK